MFEVSGNLIAAISGTMKLKNPKADESKCKKRAGQVVFV